MQKSAVGSNARDATRFHCVAQFQSTFAYLKGVVLTEGDFAPPPHDTMPGNTLMSLRQRAVMMLSVSTAPDSLTTKNDPNQGVGSARVEKPASGQRE